MNIGSATDLMRQVQLPQPAPVSPQRDRDGDNDSSRVGEVEQTESVTGTTETLGSNINVMA